MQTELLIAQLARRGGPVAVRPPTRVLLRRWAVVVLVAVVAGIAWYGAGGDASARLRSPDVVARSLLALAIAAVAARHALSLSVPGAEPDGLIRLVPPMVLATWAAALAWPLLDASLVDRLMTTRWHPQCAWQMATVAIPPAAWLYWQVRQGAPYVLGSASAHVVLAAAGAGALAVQWICALDDPAHQVLWHVVPVLVMTVLIGLAGRRLLRRH